MEEGRKGGMEEGRKGGIGSEFVTLQLVKYTE